MKKMLMTLMALAFIAPAIYAQEVDAKALRAEMNAAKKELNTAKRAACKELKDDEKIKAFNAKMKEIMEQKKAVDQEMNAYLAEKNPAYGEALAKVKAAEEKCKALRKPKKPKKDKKPKKKKKEE